MRWSPACSSAAGGGAHVHERREVAVDAVVVDEAGVELVAGLDDAQRRLRVEDRVVRAADLRSWLTRTDQTPFVAEKSSGLWVTGFVTEAALGVAVSSTMKSSPLSERSPPSRAL